MRTLVAAPTGPTKHYALPAWAAATKDYDRLVATDGLAYASVVESFGIPVVTYEPRDSSTIYGPMFTDAWTALLGASEGYTHILSLEIDVIPPDGWDILTIMECEYEPDFTCHLYPWRPSQSRTTMAQEMGCTIFSRDALARALEWTPPDRGLYHGINVGPWERKYVHLVDLTHLDEPEAPSP